MGVSHDCHRHRMQARHLKHSNKITSLSRSLPSDENKPSSDGVLFSAHQWDDASGGDNARFLSIAMEPRWCAWLPTTTTRPERDRRLGERVRARVIRNGPCETRLVWQATNTPKTTQQCTPSLLIPKSVQVRSKVRLSAPGVSLAHGLKAALPGT